MHFLHDQLSRINYGKLTIGIEIQLLNAQLFGVEIDWYGQIIDYFKKDYFNDKVPKED